MMTFDGEDNGMGGGDMGLPAAPAPEAPTEETPAAPESGDADTSTEEGTV